MERKIKQEEERLNAGSLKRLPSIKYQLPDGTTVVYEPPVLQNPDEVVLGVAAEMGDLQAEMDDMQAEMVDLQQKRIHQHSEIKELKEHNLKMKMLSRKAHALVLGLTLCVAAAAAAAGGGGNP